MKRIIAKIFGLELAQEQATFDLKKAGMVFHRVTKKHNGSDAALLASAALIAADVLGARVTVHEEGTQTLQQLAEQAAEAQEMHDQEARELQDKIMALVAEIKGRKSTMKEAAAQLAEELGEIGSQRDFTQDVMGFFGSAVG